MAMTDTPSIYELTDLRTVRIHGRTLGPLCFLAPEAKRLSHLEWNNFSAKRIAPVIGAELTDLKLNDLDDEAMAELRQAILDYKVVVIPKQAITADEQIAFSQRLGELEVHPFVRGDDERPEIVRLVKDVNTGGYENSWHSDVSWRESPARFGILRSVETPEIGGDTLFADMYSVYDGLTDEMKERVEHLVAVHDMANTFGVALSSEDAKAFGAKYPPAEHPVVRTHDETGRRLLYVNAIFTSHILGMDSEASDELLHSLIREVDNAEYQCRVTWEDDMVVIWDNQAVQHYANSDYWPNARVMERTAVKGSRPL